MKKNKIISHNARELAEIMGLDPVHALEWEMRYSLTQKIIQTVKNKHITITGLAHKAQTSRARITQILNGNSQGISIDVLLRVLAAVGQSLRVVYKEAA